jgi:hypothetical protein
MFHVFFNFFCEMLQELIHLIAFMLHDVFSNVRCFIICVFKFMIIQTADFLSVFLADVAGVSKYRGKYSAQMSYFFLSHFASLLFMKIGVSKSRIRLATKTLSHKAYKIILLIPVLISGTLKLIRKPRRLPVSLK